ncbi:MAG: sugar phosphate isomerase/epimerase family protein [Clostridia bacterium]|jgi:sugar phosphate isomerase/epimerase
MKQPTMKQPMIGTLVKGDENPELAIRQLAGQGFESFSIMYWGHVSGDLAATASTVCQAASETGTIVSSVSVYGNPLSGDEAGIATQAGIIALIDQAGSFGCSLVSCFAGRVPGTAVPASIEAWKSFFGPLAERAEARGVQLAFENCRMGDTWKTGKWNIAINPDAWHLMFDALPSETLGLEWEPCHQVEALADPLAQLKDWLPRIIHIHGKDARVNRELLASRGLYGSNRWHQPCLPGNGDTDWRELLRILVDGGYAGAVDIEGWNDAEWGGERELAGQLRALAYLKECRAVAEP